MAKEKKNYAVTSSPGSKYQASQNVIAAQKAKEQAENAVKNYGNFTYANQGIYDQAMDAILNRKPFTYDLNGDALYQQYKDQYTALGKLAMQDTMGQAAALTGGYGNSYAATAGNQAYQGYLQELNNIVPELYSLALSAYNSEGDRLNNNFNLLATDRNTQYGEWSDGYNRLVSERGYAADNYNNAYTQDYSKYVDDRNFNYQKKIDDRNFNYQKKIDDRNFNYQKEVDDRNYGLAQKEYNLAVSSASKGSVPYAYEKEADVPQELRDRIEAAGLNGFEELKGPFGMTLGLSAEEWKEQNAKKYNDSVYDYLNTLLTSNVINETTRNALMSIYYVEE